MSIWINGEQVDGTDPRVWPDGEQPDPVHDSENPDAPTRSEAEADADGF